MSTFGMSLNKTDSQWNASWFSYLRLPFRVLYLNYSSCDFMQFWLFLFGLSVCNLRISTRFFIQTLNGLNILVICHVPKYFCYAINLKTSVFVCMNYNFSIINLRAVCCNLSHWFVSKGLMVNNLRSIFFPFAFRLVKTSVT